MMRAIVNVATGRYLIGQQRLAAEMRVQANSTWRFQMYDSIRGGWPSHERVPYAFKAFALQEAADLGSELLLWCDACIRPGQRRMNDLWEKIEREGVWIGNNGYTNYEWTAESAYRELFPDLFLGNISYDAALYNAHEENRRIPHVVATAFGISTAHPTGRRFLDEYLRLAKTTAFCGPWINGEAAPLHLGGPARCSPCGPPDVRGHRHDQTAASVIAWRLGVQLTNSPEWFAYAGGETKDTCLIADGAY